MNVTRRFAHQFQFPHSKRGASLHPFGEEEVATLIHSGSTIFRPPTKWYTTKQLIKDMHFDMSSDELPDVALYTIIKQVRATLAFGNSEAVDLFLPNPDIYTSATPVGPKHYRLCPDYRIQALHALFSWQNWIKWGATISPLIPAPTLLPLGSAAPLHPPSYWWCIYCAGMFPDRSAVQEHTFTKLHVDNSNRGSLLPYTRLVVNNSKRLSPWLSANNIDGCIDLQNSGPLYPTAHSDPWEPCECCQFTTALGGWPNQQLCAYCNVAHAAINLQIAAPRSGKRSTSAFNNVREVCIGAVSQDNPTPHRIYRKQRAKLTTHPTPAHRSWAAPVQPHNWAPRSGQAT